jgi:hypothetical protein
MSVVARYASRRRSPSLLAGCILLASFCACAAREKNFDQLRFKVMNTLADTKDDMVRMQNIARTEKENIARAMNALEHEYQIHKKKVTEVMATDAKINDVSVESMDAKRYGLGVDPKKSVIYTHAKSEEDMCFDLWSAGEKVKKIYFTCSNSVLPSDDVTKKDPAMDLDESISSDTEEEARHHHHDHRKGTKDQKKKFKRWKGKKGMLPGIFDESAMPRAEKAYTKVQAIKDGVDKAKNKVRAASSRSRPLSLSYSHVL